MFWKNDSPIRRKPFVGDPADGQKPEHNPSATTARGKRRSHDGEEYKSNLDNRRKQMTPAAKTIEPHKGPHHRPKGCDSKTWKDNMNKKYPWDC